MKKLYFLLFTLTSVFTASAQIQAGDIAFTGYNSDTPDSFSFVTFVDMPAGTQIEFTDNGWQASGGFRTNEGTFIWTSPNTILTAGTVVTFTNIAADEVTHGTYANSNVNLSASGDQVFAYDPNNVPNGTNISGFYAGIQMNGGWDSDSTSSNTSANPNNGIDVVTVNANFIALDPESDSGVYDCSTTTGDVDTLKAAINDPANWTTSQSNQSLTACTFTIPTLSTDTFKTSDFSIFPNPASTGFVNIKTSNNQPIAVAAYDVLGKQVINTAVTANRLDVSSLTSGVYILKLTQEGATTTKKLVIK